MESGATSIGSGGQLMGGDERRWKLLEVDRRGGRLMGNSHARPFEGHHNPVLGAVTSCLEPFGGLLSPQKVYKTQKNRPLIEVWRAWRDTLVRSRRTPACPARSPAAFRGEDLGVRVAG